MNKLPKLSLPLLGIFNRKLAYAVLTLALILGIGGGTVYASNSAIPGDLLYPVKINFTEELQAAAKLSDEAKAEWAAERINRRLQEVEQILAVLDTVDPKIIENIQSNVEKHSSAALNAAQTLNPESVSVLLEKIQKTNQTFANKVSSAANNIQDKEKEDAISAIIESVDNTEKQTKNIALSFFAKAKNQKPVKTQEEVGSLRIIAPKKGAQLVSGVHTKLSWEPIDNAKSYEVTVKHPNGETMGLIAGQMHFKEGEPFELATEALWGVNDYNESFPKMELKTLPPGTYTIQVRAEDFDGNVFVGESTDISIVLPNKKTGTLSLEIIDENGNYINGGKIRVSNTATKSTYDLVSGGNRPTTLDNLPAGTYEVEVSTPNQGDTKTFVINIEEGKTTQKSITLVKKDKINDDSGSKNSNEDEDKNEDRVSQKNDDKVFPKIKVEMEDILPEIISAKEYEGKSLLFGKVNITPADDIIFDRLKLSCSGDSRALSGARLTTSNGVTGKIEIKPTYGGFKLEIARKDAMFKIAQNETVTVSLLLDILDPEIAQKQGAEYPRKLSCGPQEVEFINQRTGRPIQRKYFDVNILTAFKTLKTTLDR